ncbi:MAG: RidA family protein [Christensenellales bacterium]|jgi:2-iminobutanoate/2-iminopropanoate deaminase|nr:RidA family protein [Clostridiales bacterium]
MSQSITPIVADKAPAALGPYSAGMAFQNLLFLSGQTPIDPKTGDLVAGGVAEQTAQVINNLGAVLEAAGSGFDKVIKTTCFLTDMANFAAFNEVYGKAFISKPARSTVAVRALPKNALVEIELIAYRD